MPPSNSLAAYTSAKTIVVGAAGRSYSIPPRPAADWIESLAADEPVTAVVPGLMDDADFNRVGDRLLEGRVTLLDIRKMAFEAISAASGFRWWEAFTLIGICDREPIVTGLLTLAGIDPAAVPFGRWCSAVYAICIKDLDEKECQKWLARFTFPPPLAEAMDEAAGQDSFEGMIRGFRGMPGARMG